MKKTFATVLILVLFLFVRGCKMQNNEEKTKGVESTYDLLFYGKTSTTILEEAKQNGYELVQFENRVFIKTNSDYFVEVIIEHKDGKDLIAVDEKYHKILIPTEHVIDELTEEMNISEVVNLLGMPSGKHTNMRSLDFNLAGDDGRYIRVYFKSYPPNYETDTCLSSVIICDKN